MAGEAFQGVVPQAEWLRSPIDETAHAWCGDCDWLASGEWAHRSAWHHSVAHMSDPKIHLVSLWTPDDAAVTLNTEDAEEAARDLAD